MIKSSPRSVDQVENDPDYQRLCRYPAKVRSHEDEVLFKADLAYMWEDYPRFSQILVDEQETAFKDFVYAWDATEAYYTGTEALVNDVGSPSHLVEEDTIAGRVKGVVRRRVIIYDRKLARDIVGDMGYIKVVM
ncbi:hypothetical protein Tco_1578224 [Tanacetum coccineum]